MSGKAQDRGIALWLWVLHFWSKQGTNTEATSLITSLVNVCQFGLETFPSEVTLSPSKSCVYSKRFLYSFPPIHCDTVMLHILILISFWQCPGSTVGMFWDLGHYLSVIPKS